VLYRVFVRALFTLFFLLKKKRGEKEFLEEKIRHFFARKGAGKRKSYYR
jgi:hypothetical protein